MWHKHNVIISPSVGSSHLDKYSCENVHKYLSGWGTSRVKVISFKTKHYFINLGIIFKWQLPYLHMLWPFSDKFRELFSRSKHFLRTATSWQELLRQNSYLLRAAISSEQPHFMASYFFGTVTSSPQLFGQNSYFFWSKALSSIYFMKELVYRSRDLCTTSTFFSYSRYCE